MGIPLKRFGVFLGLTIAATAGLFLGFFLVQRHRSSPIVQAAAYPQAWGMTQARESEQSTSGGMAQYGYAIQQATDLSTDAQAITNWNSYVASRSGWSMSSAIATRLANGDWNARQAGPPAITPQQLANGVNHLINSVLSTMTASQQLVMFQQNMSVMTPKGGMFGLNGDELWEDYISGTQNPDGTWTVTVSPGIFSKRKSSFQSLAPGMVTSSANFYPGEALMVTISLATGDKGFDDAYQSRVKMMIQDLTGVDMTSQSLYGDSGYVARRPLTTFLTDVTLGQLYSDLGF